jgi:hypothetical protein
MIFSSRFRTATIQQGTAGIPSGPIGLLRWPALGLGGLMFWALMGFHQLLWAQSPAQIEAIRAQSVVTELLELAERWAQTWRADSLAVAQWSARTGEPIREELPEGGLREVIRLDDAGLPVYRITQNDIAAISINTHSVQPGGVTGLNLTGAGYKLGEWDGGAVRLTHRELAGRVTQVDGHPTVLGHATHVAGTLIATGLTSRARGMAIGAQLDAYHWDNDNAEMAAAAAGGLLISNHSYGTITGWFYNSTRQRWEWYGQPWVNANEDWRFGAYVGDAPDWDSLAAMAPYYLIVKSAGNDRNDVGPGAGQEYFVQDLLGNWQASTEPRDPDGPWDCLSSGSVAKNVLVIGAVQDLPNGYTQPSDVQLANFSSVGPVDDGRIKPDLVGNGVQVYSTGANSDQHYFNSSGTSMSGPSVAGSLLLLQELYARQRQGALMRASTLRALALHTTDEAGPGPGPDYEFGWGLMNTRRATEVILAPQGTHQILEANLQQGHSDTLRVFASGLEPLRATLAWTDPAGTRGPTARNDTTPALVNDLDLRIRFEGQTFLPWVLDRNQPTAPATRGDNHRDNVEQVLAPQAFQGWVEVIIRHKGNLRGGQQWYSLLLSGVAPPPLECNGQTVLRAPNGTLADGSGVLPYAANATCSWLIEPAQATSILLVFTDFETQSGADLVRVYDGPDTLAPLLGTFSGSQLPPALQSTGGSLLVTFISDGSVQLGGWAATYSAAINLAGSCAGTTLLLADSASFDDGSGGLDYQDFRDCRWLIQPPGAGQLELSFTQFRTQAARDFVWIYDGPDTLSPLLGRFSGTQLPGPFVSSTGSLLIVFRTDSSGQDQGWAAQYRRLPQAPPSHCQGVQLLTMASGTFSDGSGSQQYRANSNCSWLIQPPGALNVELRFLAFRTEAANDVVRVYDGASTLAPLLGEFSGTQLPPRLQSSGGSLLVTFQSNASLEDLGFTAQYTSRNLPAFCQPQTLVTAAGGTLTDGSGPDSYESNANCRWVIQPSGAVALSLWFEYLDTEENYDWVEVFDGISTTSPLLGRYSGSQRPSDTLRATGASMLVRFQSDAIQQRDGFTLRWLAQGPLGGCGSDTVITQPAGLLDDGSGPAQYGDRLDCQWHLAPPSGAPLTLTFRYFDTERFYDELFIYDGPDDQSPLLARLSGQQLPLPLTAQSGKAFLRFLTDSHIAGLGWLLEFSDGTPLPNSISEPLAPNSLRLYPNPATTSVTVGLPQAAPAGSELRIMNAMGQVVQRHPIPLGVSNVTLDTGALPGGVYVIQCSQAGVPSSWQGRLMIR